MPKIYKYQKVTDQYTTYTVNDEDNKITELCTINGDTYVSIPDDVTFQSKQITLEPVTITKELKEQIEKESPHLQLIRKRVIEAIRKKYSIEDELNILRNKINGIDIEYQEYNKYVEDCLTEGKKDEDKLLQASVEPK